MSQYKSLMIKSSNSQFNRLKSGIKNGTEVTLNLLRKVIEDSNDQINYFWLTNKTRGLGKLLQKRRQPI